MSKLKHSLKYLERLILPLTATVIIVDIWETLNKFLIILLIIYLVLGILEKLDIRFKPILRMKKSKLGKIFFRVVRSSNPITQFTEEHLDETSEIIAENIKIGTKKIKEIREEKKLKKLFEKLKLILKHNKTVFTGYVLAMLYILEVRFHWATDLGIPKDWLPYIAVAIVAFIFYVMFGEGFTFNDINKIKEAAIQAKKDALVAIGKTQSEYNKNKARVDELKGMFKDNIPSEYADEWNILHLKMEKLTFALDSLNEDLDKAKLLIKTGKE